MLSESNSGRRFFMAPRQHMNACIERERVVHLRVQDLVLCGVRPKVIYQVIGKQMSLNEVKRIHDSITPIPPDKRHGRNIKFENIHLISAPAHSLYIECFKLVKRALAAGGSRADALCSVWRIMADRRSLPFHADIENASCEAMIVLYLNYEVDDLTIETCDICRSPFLSAKSFRCMACEGTAKRKRQAA
ncbi:hypothetical protein Rfer_4268 (plasmid) [Rhodoferax ferrireducens T118]|uniref:Flagellar transcriptional regulator FlhC n=1 Tax=Albidiferax ferrireducens (strain ATCC BAA-621 / DSM 15236 / T118) TaxID=338969 RepID=Q21QJ0_ALBFT|nr:hypothetical protein [Rhodoferax ferrireducens]ABD71955.1 hypothetical protein Rfer_4268 [Rhodoferax ferrireducens T118]